MFEPDLGRVALAEAAATKVVFRRSEKASLATKKYRFTMHLNNNMDTNISTYIPKGTKTKQYGNLFVYDVAPDAIVETCAALHQTHGLPLKTITAFDDRESSGAFTIMYVFGVPKKNIFLAPRISVKEEFPSLTPVIHEASPYERKIMTLFGLKPVGHPDPRSLILHENWPDNIFPLRKDFDWQTRPKEAHTPFEFRRFEGEGVYEIPVGPVHAGIIEPGHFRFSVAGEEILMLEPRLGYCHKGSEKLFEVLSLPDKLKLSERISGDSSFSHSLAFCQALESLAGIKISEQDALTRVVFAELERLANHFGDIGAIMIDTGFNFGGAHGARLREIVMRLNDALAGHRFLRGVNTIGGVAQRLNAKAKKMLLEQLEMLETDFSEVMAVANNSTSLMNRLKGTGVLPERIAKDHGVVGVAGRAVGFDYDARVDYPYAAYDGLKVIVPTETGGDVFARFSVRVKEVSASFEIIKQALAKLPKEPAETKPVTPPFPNNGYAVGIVEGWRGDIVYLVATDAKGNISRVAPRDPSFLNWTALGHAGAGNMVPDFPLINKSFNLSYTGNDL